MANTFRLVIARIAVGLLLPAACMSLEEPTSSAASQLVVHAILNKGDDKVVVLISRARTGVAPATRGGISDDEPVRGALVTVTAPNGIVMIASNAVNADSSATYEPGVYALNPSSYGVHLAEGGTYSLHVRTPSGQEASGTTTIPLGPGSWTGLPRQTFVRARDTLRLSWPQVPGARSYELVLSSFGSVNYRTFTDTAVTLPGTALTIQGDMVFPLGARMEVWVIAVDVNYYDYYRAQSDPFAGAAPSHLSGAVGVFGSLAPIIFGQIDIR